MKNKNKQIEEEIQKTFELLDQVKDIEPNPYFYPRLLEHLKSQKEGRKEALGGIIKFKKLRLAFLAIVIINILSGILLLQNNFDPTENRKQTLEVLAKEYLIIQEDFNY